MTPLELLECRYDGPIPARERDAARYPTKANKVERAKARITWANQEIAWHMRQWRFMRTYALSRGLGWDRFDALRRIAGIHMPHLRYSRQERLRWQRHLATLEAS